MKRKLETGEELEAEIGCGDADEFRDQLLEKEFSNKTESNEDEFVSVVKLCGMQPNLALPQDWVGMYHKSGGIIYLNRKTRVCTWARPYHIGKASVRKHEVPSVAIPCLHQILALKNMKTQKSHKKQKVQDIFDGVNGHRTGQLSDQSGDHDNHHGSNYENKINRKVVDGCHGSSDDGSHTITDSNSTNTDGNHTGAEGCHSNTDGYHSNTDGNHSNADDNHSNTDGNHSNTDGCHSNTDGNCSNTDGNHSNTDGNHSNTDGNHSNTDGNHSNTDCNHSNTDDNHSGDNILNSTNNSSTSDITSIKNINKDDDNATNQSKYAYSRKELETSDSNNITSQQENYIKAKNKTVSKIKAEENYEDSDDSDSGTVGEDPETAQLELHSVEEIRSYLSKLWEFKEITKDEESQLLFTDTNEIIPQDAKEGKKSSQILQTIPYFLQGKNVKSNEKVAINPAGKSARSLLHEYCLKVLNVKPEYSTTESGVAKTPFSATVFVDGLKYGSGMAASKKQAKHLAAQKTMEIFLPLSFKKLIDIEENLKIFDDIPVEDPNVYELTSKLGLLSPYQVLKECIKRNQGVLTSEEVKFELNHGEDKQLYYTMEYGKHKATGICPNKKYGREFAAQTILQKLHPKLKCWGSVLRIYVDEHTAQEFAKPDVPAEVTPSNVNKELLSDLKHEMRKIMKEKPKTTKGFFTSIDV